jgi:hypothetical protein
MSDRPIPYIPYLDPELKIDPVKSLQAGLREELRESLSFFQTEIGLMSRIKEKAKDDPEILDLCRNIIQSTLFIIKLTREEMDALCE